MQSRLKLYSKKNNIFQVNGKILKYSGFNVA